MKWANSDRDLGVPTRSKIEKIKVQSGSTVLHGLVVKTSGGTAI